MKKDLAVNIENYTQYINLAPGIDSLISKGYENMDKVSACKKLKADYLFVGDDWYNSDKWNEYEAQLQEIGCKVIYFPYTGSTSSTLL